MGLINPLTLEKKIWDRKILLSVNCYQVISVSNWGYYLLEYSFHLVHIVCISNKSKNTLIIDLGVFLTYFK